MFGQHVQKQQVSLNVRVSGYQMFGQHVQPHFGEATRLQLFLADRAHRTVRLLLGVLGADERVDLVSIGDIAGNVVVHVAFQVEAVPVFRGAHATPERALARARIRQLLRVGLHVLRQLADQLQVVKA